MHVLPILRQACLEALKTDGDPDDSGRFSSIVNARSVLELIQVAETRFSDKEVCTLR